MRAKPRRPRGAGQRQQLKLLTTLGCVLAFSACGTSSERSATSAAAGLSLSGGITGHGAVEGSCAGNPGVPGQDVRAVPAAGPSLEYFGTIGGGKHGILLEMRIGPLSGEGTVFHPSLGRDPATRVALAEPGLKPNDTWYASGGTITILHRGQGKVSGSMTVTLMHIFGSAAPAMLAGGWGCSIVAPSPTAASVSPSP
jgi:hypothetical protein